MFGAYFHYDREGLYKVFCTGGLLGVLRLAEERYVVEDSKTASIEKRRTYKNRIA